MTAEFLPPVKKRAPSPRKIYNVGLGVKLQGGPLRPRQLVPSPSFWRDMLAGWLRGLAMRMDGRPSLALTVVDSHGLLERDEVERSLLAGFKHASQCMAECARASASEDEVE